MAWTKKLSKSAMGRMPRHAVSKEMALAGYSESEMEVLLRLHGHWAETLSGDLDRLSAELGYSDTIIYKVWMGRYNAPNGLPANREPYMDAVLKLLRRASMKAGVFVETSTTRKIFRVLDMARNYGSIVHISGPARAMKTESALEYKSKNNHGKTIYIDPPVEGGLGPIVKLVAKNLKISTAQSISGMTEEIEKSVTKGMLMIFDEAGRLFPRTPRDTSKLDWVRRMNDVCHCGVALISTDTFVKDMATARFSAYMAQLSGRIIQPLKIPDVVRPVDVRSICQAYTSNPDEELLRKAMEVANCSGRYGLLFMLMSQARTLAVDKGEALDISHLDAAIEQRNGVFTWNDDEEEDDAVDE